MLLTGTHRLADGTCARVRLPHAHDRGGLAALLHRLGLDLGELDAGRLLRSDPQREAVLCATVWTSDGDVLVGYAATGRDGSTVLSDEQLAAGIGDLLAEALEQRFTHRRAA